MNETLKLLLATDSEVDVGLLLHALRDLCFRVKHAVVDTPADMRIALQECEWDLITCNYSMGQLTASAALALAKELCPQVPLVILAREIDLNVAVSLLKAGARDVIKMDELARLAPVIERELRDSTRRRERERSWNQLIESQALFRAIVENVGDLVAVLDTDGRRIYNSPSYGPLFRQEDIRVGSNSFLEVHVEDRQRIREIFNRTVSTGNGQRAEFRFVLKDGSIRHMQSDGRAIRALDGKVSKVVVVSRDITALKRLEIELREIAATDSLTGLPSRRHFLSRLEQESARIRRHQGHRAAVLMLDCDRFKMVNDEYGHAAGDQVLKHLASLVTHELRKFDIAGRLGGEEFAIILSGADLASAEAFAERLRKKVATTPKTHGEKVLRITISMGVASMGAADVRGEDALSRADRALYRAKERGRDQVAVED